MPIRHELRALYPPHWRDLSHLVRFERAGGRCQGCGRPHLAQIRCLPDGRWFDEAIRTWRDRRGRPAHWPDLMEATRLRSTRVVLAAAHLDHHPENNRLRNLRALCQRCHMLHDRPHHLAQRRITYRRRWALGDLFAGPYAAPYAAPDPSRTASAPRRAVLLGLLPLLLAGQADARVTLLAPVSPTCITSPFGPRALVVPIAGTAHPGHSGQRGRCHAY